MKKLFVFSILLLLCLPVCAQVQQGVVRTIGRPNQPGQVLSGVTIRVRGGLNAVVSGGDGTFSIPLRGSTDGDAFVLQQVQKQGYELQDRSVIGRRQVTSSRVPIIILMVSTAQLQADRERIEANAYRRAERNYRERTTTLEQRLQQQTISAEEYRQQLAELQDNYEKYLALVSDLADRYARTDYDQLDSIDRVINICIEEGDLDRADSLIHTIFDPETVLERNRQAKQEIAERIAFAQSVIDKAQADREAILRDMDYAHRVVALTEALVEEYLLQGERAKALDCLEKLVQIKTALYGEDSPEVRATVQKAELLKQP